MIENDIAQLKRYGDAPFLIFCDHASNYIPLDFDGLGIPDDFLETHIAWDIGAGPLAEAIAKKLNATAFCCSFSRLVVDVNRALDATDIIPKFSDQIPIPGNQMLGASQHADRIEKYHIPYHRALASALDDIVALHIAPFVVSVHSFTHRLMGGAENRPWQAGLLWRHDETSARAMINFLTDYAGWRVGDNEPYDARIFNYSIDRNVAPRNIAHLTLEIRQDVISNKEEICSVADIVARGIVEVSA